MQLVKDIRDVTDEMIKFAENREWEKVAEVNQQRQHLFAQLETRFQTEQDIFTSSVLEEIKAKNDALLAVAMRLTDESKDSLGKIKSQKKAANAYAQM